MLPQLLLLPFTQEHSSLINTFYCHNCHTVRLGAEGPSQTQTKQGEDGVVVASFASSSTVSAAVLKGRSVYIDCLMWENGYDWTETDQLAVSSLQLGLKASISCTGLHLLL